jgi:hypothetical protein
MDHNVLWFQISVDNFFSVALADSIDDLLKDIDSFVLKDFAFFLNFGGQIISVAVL